MIKYWRQYLINLIFYLLIIIPFSVGLILLIFTYKKFISESNRFRDYLLAMGDEDSLRKIGRLNSRKQRVFNDVPIFEVDNALTEKFKQTGNEKYILFNKQYKKLLIRIRILLVFLFVLFVVYQIATLES